MSFYWNAPLIVSCSNVRSVLRYLLRPSFPERIHSPTQRHFTIQSWTSWRTLKRYKRSMISLHGGTGAVPLYLCSCLLANQVLWSFLDRSSPAICQHILFVKPALWPELSRNVRNWMLPPGTIEGVWAILCTWGWNTVFFWPTSHRIYRAQFEWCCPSLRTRLLLRNTIEHDRTWCLKLDKLPTCREFSLPVKHDLRT